MSVIRRTSVKGSQSIIPVNAPILLISKFLPWKVEVYIAFETIEQAQGFEKYLKTGSGRAFANRHFWSSCGKPQTPDYS
jgi:hypothetical protein